MVANTPDTGKFIMFLEYMTLWHLQMLVLYILANCAVPWYVIWSNRRLKPDDKRDTAKFAPWVRLDVNEWSYLRCIFTHFFFIIRYGMLLGILLVAFCGGMILSIGANIDNLSPTRQWIVLQYSCLLMRIFCPLFGAFNMKMTRP